MARTEPTPNSGERGARRAMAMGAIVAAASGVPADAIDAVRGEAERAACDWCGGSGVMRIEREADGAGGGCVPCSHCRGEAVRDG